MGQTFTHRIRVRYSECDAQGVVFNANYYAYFDLLLTELWREAIGPLRDAIRPFDGSAEDGVRDRGNKTDNWAPSRLKSIEEVPIAIGFLIVANGDFEQSIFGAANYGRDNDSIAGMAGGIAGALHGDGVIRPEWIAQINAANRVDLDPLVRDLTRLAVTLQQEQLAAAQTRQNEFAILAQAAG